eukprot:38684-Eustigmatos_ZCMA.PRE.1
MVELPWLRIQAEVSVCPSLCHSIWTGEHLLRPSTCKMRRVTTGCHDMLITQAEVCVSQGCATACVEGCIHPSIHAASIHAEM